ncbi:MAG: hypothetical protein DWQ01_07160 [Planctomycetota bacterium]|nr:MAG: hypothetical protein DWQ01_07160 [Planctomycetota bacterium]
MEETTARLNLPENADSQIPYRGFKFQSISLQHEGWMREITEPEPIKVEIETCLFMAPGN